MTPDSSFQTSPKPARRSSTRNIRAMVVVRRHETPLNPWLLLLWMLLTILMALLLPALAEADQINMNLSTINTTSRKVESTTAHSGNMDSFFKDFAAVRNQMFAKLNINFDTLPETTKQALSKPPTNNFKAFVAFSTGLHYQDQGDFGSARIAFRMASSLDPGFTQAIQAEATSPRNSMTLGQLRAQSQNNTRKLVSDISNNRRDPVHRSTPPAPPPPPPPTDANTTGGNTQTTANVLTEVDQQVQQTNQQLNTLASQVQSNPDSAGQLLDNALANQVDPGLALETVLNNVTNVSRETVFNLINNAADKGLTEDDVNKLIKQIAAERPCG